MTDTAADHAISLRGVDVMLAGRRVLRDISLDARPGELIAVIGANGAGKSTLLKVIAGLITPESGTVSLGGRDTRTYPPRDLAKRVAYLPQDRIVHWPLDVAHIIGLGRLPYRNFAAGPSHADLDAIADAMHRLDVARFSERPIATLSGGEQARVLLARALAQSAQILIADEPTAGLDPAHTLSMFAEFERLARDGNIVIVAIHDLSLAARFATRVVVVRSGECIANGPPAHVLSTDTLRAAFDVNAVVAEVDGVPVVVLRPQ